MLGTDVFTGFAVAAGYVAFTVMSVWLLLAYQKPNWYVSVSWLMIGLGVLALTSFLAHEEWTTAISFTVTCMLLLVVPRYVNFYGAVECFSILCVSSIIFAAGLMSTFFVKGFSLLI